MEIILKDEIVVPEKRFDRYHVQSIRIQSEGLEGKLRARVDLIAFASGSKEMSDGPAKTIEIDDVQNAEMSGPLQAFLAAVEKLLV